MTEADKSTTHSFRVTSSADSDPQSNLNDSILDESRDLSAKASDESLHWYVLRCFYGKELTLQQRIQDNHLVECFVPIEKIRQKDKHGRFVWTQRCALTGYVFVHTYATELSRLTGDNPNTFVMSRKEKGLWRPVTVPDRDMASFIRVAGNKEQRIAYLDPSKLNLRQGDRVRVIGGSFVGVEGTFMQIGGKHEKRVIIQLDNLIAVATAAIPASLVEKIQVS